MPREGFAHPRDGHLYRIADSLDLLRSVPARLDEPITEAIVAKADGNPLFLEQRAFDAGEADEGRSAGTVPDTILFPGLRTILKPKQVEALGARMEEDEHKVLGDEGFEKAVAEVAGIEKALGIYDLTQFTPHP